MSEIWSPQQAADWYKGVSPIVGCNYLPRTAVNSTDMWQAGSFEPDGRPCDEAEIELIRNFAYE